MRVCISIAQRVTKHARIVPRRIEGLQVQSSPWNCAFFISLAIVATHTLCVLTSYRTLIKHHNPDRKCMWVPGHHLNPHRLHRAHKCCTGTSRPGGRHTRHRLDTLFRFGALACGKPSRRNTSARKRTLQAHKPLLHMRVLYCTHAALRIMYVHARNTRGRLSSGSWRRMRRSESSV